MGHAREALALALAGVWHVVTGPLRRYGADRPYTWDGDPKPARSGQRVLAYSRTVTLMQCMF
ncbi:hypothetical protein A5747_13220 [Mycobacterium sp. IS-836]|nr:hypothetical protein A5747_13220 [Mycobacterium sp. IS-836]